MKLNPLPFAFAALLAASSLFAETKPAALAAPRHRRRPRTVRYLRRVERQALMDIAQLGALFLHFLMLSFLAIGGAPSVLPDIHRYVVEVHGFMTSTQFAELYTLAQVAPGPNVMYLPLVGWHIAGWTGAAVTSIPFLVPSVTLTLLIAHLHARHPTALIGVAIRRGLTPITIGLIFASGWETGPSSQDERAANFSGVPWLIRAEDGDHDTGPVSRRGGLEGGPGYPP